MGKIIIVVWALLSLLSSKLILDSITPAEVDLGDFSCSKATYNECVEKEIKPRATEDIRTDLIKKLENINNIGLIFKLPLKVVSFKIGIVDRGSRLDLTISNPQYKETLLSTLDLECKFADKYFPLETNGKINTGEFLRLDNLNEGNVENTAKDIAGKFGGCDLAPKNNIHIITKTSHEVAPGGIISLKEVIRPYLVFESSILSWCFIFFVLFTIIGGILGLARQACQLWKNGFDYFRK